MIIKMCGNLPLDPLILDLATIPRDHACSSVNLTLTEPRFHLSISECRRNLVSFSNMLFTYSSSFKYPKPISNPNSQSQETLDFKERVRGCEIEGR
ncbi:Ribonuclease P protein subunit p25 [Corchorus olitorius]|uniref:Ribonuclease P protein subunit p25 n=1 Tax=Corchorus olitorius TaxID=93759 RepID=A0A1R3KUS2_9ROSI|nr:Ribonuclease P protein subunit p25 [Corchorus olitorius]